MATFRMPTVFEEFAVPRASVGEGRPDRKLELSRGACLDNRA